jgi:hypothetical protein
MNIAGLKISHKKESLDGSDIGADSRAEDSVLLGVRRRWYMLTWQEGKRLEITGSAAKRLYM